MANNAVQYNESTLLLVLKHMIYSLTHPTPPLEVLIRDHFRRRAPAIIRRCQRILEKASSSAATAACAAGMCSSSPGAAGGGSGGARGASASAAGAGDTHESQERMDDGGDAEAAGDAVGWADRSLAFLSARWRSSLAFIHPSHPLLSSPNPHPFPSHSVGLITVSGLGLFGSSRVRGVVAPT